MTSFLPAWALAACLLSGDTPAMALQQAEPGGTPPAAQPEQAPPVQAPPTQATPPAASQGFDAPSDETIAARIAAINTLLAKIDAAPEGRKEEGDALRAALGFLTQAAEQEAALRDLRTRAEAAEDQADAATAELAALAAAQTKDPLSRLDPQLSPEPTVEELSATLQTARTSRDADQQQVQYLTERLTLQESRRGAITPEIAQRKARADEIRAGKSVAPDPATAPEVVAARRALRGAELSFLQARIATLELEAQSLEPRIAALHGRREVARARVANSDRVLAALQARLDSRRTELSEAQRRAAEEQERQLANEHELVREVASKNTDRAKQLEAVSQQILKANEDRASLAAERAAVEDAYEEAKIQEERLGRTEVYGRWMRIQRGELRAARSLRQDLASTNADLRSAQTNIFELQGIEIDDPEGEADDRIAAFEQQFGFKATFGMEMPDEQQRLQLGQQELEALQERLDAKRESLRETLVATLRVKSETTSRLVQEYERLIAPALVQLQAEQLLFLDLVTEYTAFIDERVLWIQSTTPLHKTSIQDHVDGFAWLLRGDAWLQSMHALGTDVRRAPIPLTFALLLVTVAFATQRRVKRLLKQLTERAANPFRGHFGHTIAAVAVTGMLAAPVPAALGIVAWRMVSGAEGADFPNAVAMGLAWATPTLAFGLLLLAMTRPEGLGPGHFGWSDRTTHMVRRYTRVFMPLALPLITALGILQSAEASLHDAAGRDVLILVLILACVVGAVLLHPKRGIPASILTRYPQSWLARLRFVWYGTAVLLPIGTAIAASVGYLYTAERLTVNIRRTVWLVLLLVFLYALLVRALSDAQRRLSIEQWRRRRTASGQKPEASESPPIPEEAIDIDAVSDQARRLLRLVTLIGLFVGLAVAWADVLPAFRALENVPLWQTQAAGATLDDGQPKMVPVTLWNVMLSIVVLLVTTLVVRNVPGLLEMTLLRRLPISAAGRYATTTVCRYVIVTIGVILAFGAIRIGWSHVQFLAAAITVGLGFGLQEIFANFVSGLILLFEQPVRVGDTVTIGNVSGTVSRIQMRATTIVDFDRKELVVPNKEFVTGQIINWTLTDAVLRIIVPVGVAYGSDTNAVREALLGVADKHPNVLAEPSPQAFFLGFGDNSLNFELRVFLPSMERFMETRHELHMAVDAACRERGIEIAFPQRDLHLRTTVPLQVEIRNPSGKDG